MASSTRASFSAADGLPETEKNPEETENTYILRPIFQQRRVADGLCRADSGNAGSGRQKSPRSWGVGKERPGWRGWDGAPAGGEAGLGGSGEGAGPC